MWTERNRSGRRHRRFCRRTISPPPQVGSSIYPQMGRSIPSSGEEYIYIPPLLVAQEGNTMALTPPVGQAGVPSTPLPSGQVDSLGSTASEALPSDNIPPPFFS